MFRSFSQYYQLAKKTATNKSYSCINREVVATTKTVSTIWFGAQIFAYCKCDTIEIRYNRTECVVQSHQVPLSCIGNKVYIVLCLQCHRMIQKCVSNSERFKFGTFQIRNSNALNWSSLNDIVNCFQVLQLNRISQSKIPQRKLWLVANRYGNNIKWHAENMCDVAELLKVIKCQSIS